MPLGSLPAKVEEVKDCASLPHSPTRQTYVRRRLQGSRDVVLARARCPLVMLGPEARQCLRVVAGDQLAWTVGVPVRGKEGSVIAIGKALVEQRDDPYVGFRADEAAGGLHDAAHAGAEIGIGEAMLIFIFVVRADQLLL